jgi:hypothetical protein
MKLYENEDRLDLRILKTYDLALPAYQKPWLISRNDIKRVVKKCYRCAVTLTIGDDWLY